MAKRKPPEPQEEPQKPYEQILLSELTTACKNSSALR